MRVKYLLSRNPFSAAKLLSAHGNRPRNRDRHIEEICEEEIDFVERKNHKCIGEIMLDFH